MCGIVGYIGSNNAAQVVYKDLEKLEYRGYDSAGLATIFEGKICCRKDAGPLSLVEEKHRLSLLPGNIGIGHVRWATHGAPNQCNSHPHLDCHQEIAVVHNGIIENYQEIRSRLKSKHHFISETDTEVIPHLIEEYMDSSNSLEEALRRAVKEIKGYYALLVISSREPGKIVATCRDEPLIIGLGNNGTFIASDFLAFLEETRRAIHLENGDIAVLSGNKVNLSNSEGKEIKREPVDIEWKCYEATKQGYDYFMLKEIMEQPQAIRRALVQDREQIATVATDILRTGQVIFTACGTSRYAALLGRYLFSKIGGKFSDVIMGSEFQYFSESIDKNTLILAISQSGETADIVAGVKKAREQKATVFSITNKEGSLISRMSQRVIHLNGGPEIGVAATKSFTSQLVVLYLLSFAMRNKLDEVIGKIEGLSFLIEENLRNNGNGVARLAQKLKESRDCYFIARGGNLHIASEAALKLKEIAYIHAEGMPAGELKHGTLALVEKGTPIVAICPHDSTFHDTISNATEAKARGGHIIGVSDCYDEIFDDWIQLPVVEEIFYPLVTIIPLQLLAYYTAVAKGLDPDRPRNLAKSVTVK